MKNNLYLTFLKLDDKVVYIQKNQLVGNFLKLILTNILFIKPLLHLSILFNSTVLIINNITFKKYLKKNIHERENIDLEIKNKIIKILKRSLPTNLYYCFSSQITIWIVSLIGTTQHLATIGALGRFGIVFSIFNIVFNQVITPKFTLINNKSENKRKLLKVVNLTIYFSIIFIIIIIFIIYYSSDFFYLIIGKQYKYDIYTLLFVMIGSCFSSLAGMIYSLYVSKGWVIDPRLSISINFLSLVFGFLIIDSNNLNQVLFLNCILILIQIVMNVYYIKYKINKIL